MEYIKNPKRPRTDKKGNAIRHIPRGAYNRVPVDALLKYFYKYSFHHFCTSFKVEFKGCNTETFTKRNYPASLILEVINYLYESTRVEGVKEFAGLPIIEGGVVCHFNPDDLDDAKFTCTIRLVYEIDSPDRPDTRLNEVIYVGK